MATYINAPLKRFILSCGFRNKRKMTKGMKKTYKIKPSILHRIEINKYGTIVCSAIPGTQQFGMIIISWTAHQ